MTHGGPVRRLSFRARRVFGFALLAHYAAAVFIIPVAHAALADHRPLRAAHVERLGDTTCQPVHSHLNCSAFGAARLLAASSGAVRIEGGDRVLTARLAREFESRPTRPALGILGSRAPPLA